MPFPSLLAYRRQCFTHLVEVDQMIKARLHAECGGSLLPPIVASPSGDLLDLEATHALEPGGSVQQIAEQPALPPAPARQRKPRTSTSNGQPKTTREIEILDTMRKNASKVWTIDEISEATKHSRIAIKSAMYRMRAKGLVESCGSSLFRATAGGTTKRKPTASSQSSAPAAAGKGGTLDSMAVQVTTMLHGQPLRTFTPADVDDRLGCGLKRAQNALFHAERAGRIRRISRGVYQSTQVRP